jgi:hypothetical protein
VRHTGTLLDRFYFGLWWADEVPKSIRDLKRRANRANQRLYDIGTTAVLDEPAFRAARERVWVLDRMALSLIHDLFRQYQAPLERLELHQQAPRAVRRQARQHQARSTLSPPDDDDPASRITCARGRLAGALVSPDPTQQQSLICQAIADLVAL